MENTLVDKQSSERLRKSGLNMDPIKFEVIRSAFVAASDEMSVALRKASYSTNIKTRADFSCALFDSKLRLIAQSFTQPVHLGSMPRIVPTAVGKYGVENLGPGDALIINDPYCNAVHLNDVSIIAPFFSDQKLVGYAATIAHHVDIGGYAPGGYCISTELYQEGIIIPVSKLVSKGKVVDDIFNLILANIRSPRQSAGDLRAQLAAALLGQKRMAEIIGAFGEQTVETFVDELIDYTERWSRQEISALAQGEYSAEAFRDNDGVSEQPIRLVLGAKIQGEEVFFDLTGSDAQRESPMNCTLTQTFSACAYVVKCLINPDVPANEGFYKLIHVDAPSGTVVNARHPAGVVGGWDIAMRLCDLGFKLFSDAMPQKVVACSKSINCHMACGGRDPRTGEYYTFIETMAGGGGARPIKDGLDAVQAHFQNTENSAIEETENNYPFMIMRYELIPDSEGAGNHRGGLGVRRDWKFCDHGATLTILCDSQKFPPWGLFGGGSGAASHYLLNPDGEQKELPSKVTLRLKPNDVISYRTPGGGGYGSPLKRDPERVLKDVINGKVTPERARKAYGVVVDAKQRVVQIDETLRLRSQSDDTDIP